MDSLFFIVTATIFVPLDTTDLQWKYQSWEQVGQYYEFSATSEFVFEKCRQNPTSVIQLPRVIEAEHTVSTGTAKTIFNSFENVESHYALYSIPCADIQTGSFIWKVRTYSSAYAFFHHFPAIQSQPSSNFFSESAIEFVAGILTFLAIFIAGLFYGTSTASVYLLLPIGAFLFSIHFFSESPYLLFKGFHINFTHRLSEITAWSGSAVIIETLRRRGLLNTTLCYFQYFTVVISIFFSLFSSNKEVIAFSAMFPYSFTMILFVWATISLALQLFRSLTKATSRNTPFFWQLLSVSILPVTVINDILLLSGAFEGHVLLPFGILAVVLSIAFAENDEIRQTYKQRDYLVKNLEIEVEKRTKELDQSRLALVQQEKMALLGSISTGIAHEFNNSLNIISVGMRAIKIAAVKGSTEKIIAKADAIIDTCNLAADIVKSIKFSKKIKNENKEVRPFQLLTTIFQLLKGETLEDFEIINSVPKDFYFISNESIVYSSLLNLVQNAIDASEATEQKKITISMIDEKQTISFDISDFGIGVEKENQERIFEEFTTKEAGLGIGLKFIKENLQAIEATVGLVSTKNPTTFRLTFRKT